MHVNQVMVYSSLVGLTCTTNSFAFSNPMFCGVCMSVWVRGVCVCVCVSCDLVMSESVWCVCVCVCVCVCD